MVGKPDESVGEIIVAILTLRKPDGTADLTLEFSNERSAAALRDNAKLLKPFLQDKLAHYKQPRDVVIVDSIPRNHMGKVRMNLFHRFVKQKIYCEHFILFPGEQEKSAEGYENSQIMQYIQHFLIQVEVLFMTTINIYLY